MFNVNKQWLDSNSGVGNDRFANQLLVVIVEIKLGFEPTTLTYQNVQQTHCHYEAKVWEGTKWVKY